ncbi:hypothetical protein SAMN05216371_0166 [Streptomyces sp. TLI_053]|uniref:hypothetical protein n=1 Tax=Streptomyces sp. TLI_053 TaxID=1855352 RepID=UPI00087CC5B3|nr:hypothetical protein [Streptomyces sp. TLI_053]SDS56230.1 hypothetical protein SAMN05216371_0166 [Streptomyces sp. TLI_053]
MRRWVWWTVAGLCAAAGAGLVAVALWVDLETADKVASVVGAVLALAGLAFTVRALLRERPPGAGAAGTGAPDTGGGFAAAAGGGDGAGDGAVREVRVRVEGGGVGAGGDITAAGTVRPTAPDDNGGVTPRIDRRDIHVTGPGSVGAGGDIHGIDLNGNHQ